MAFTKKTTAAATANPPRRSGRLAKKRAQAPKKPKPARSAKRTKQTPKQTKTNTKKLEGARDLHSAEGWDYKKQHALNADQVQDLKYLVWQFGAPHEGEDQKAVLATLSRAVDVGEVTLYELDSMCWAFQAGVSTLKHMMHEIKRFVA